MDYLERYKKRIGGSEAPISDFIKHALNKIEIHKYESGESTGEGLEAVLIFKDKEGPDTAILYTYAKDGLEVGDSIIKKGHREENDSFFLILEEQKRVDTSVHIRVFNTLETNVNILGSDIKKPAYAMSNLSSVIRTSERQGGSIEVKKTVLVAPRSYKVRLEDILDLENLSTGEQSYASWRVEGIDDITSPHVVYAHLEQTTKKKDEKPEPVEPNVETVKSGQTLELSTESGFIKTVPSARVIDRKSERVRIQVPAGTDTLIVTVKKDRVEVETIYKVKEWYYERSYRRNA